ncbi:MAG TPA: glycosyltransferase family 4 protein [Thermoanaerobaculia bacterium]
MTRLCVVSGKECWEQSPGVWVSTGGFPAQVGAIGSLFDETTLVIVRGRPREGAIPLPASARVVPLRKPPGRGVLRKAAVGLGLPYYAGRIGSAVAQSDAVYAPLPGDVSFLGFAAAVLLRRRLLARYGSSWVETAQTTRMNRVTRLCMRFFAGDSAVMIATGEGDAPPARGVEWLYATALTRRELDGIDAQCDRGLSAPPRLAYLGRLSPEKGVAVLIQALGRLRSERFEPLPHALLIGDGPQRAELESLAGSLNCADLVTFAGQLDRPGLSRRLSEVDVCVQPSLTEGHSKAWLDAMAHGLPVLASEVGAARRVIGEDGERGWLVPPGDPAALAAQLARVLRSPRDWPALRRRCRAYADGRTLEAWTRRIGELCAVRWRVRYADGRLWI